MAARMKKMFLSELDKKTRTTQISRDNSVESALFLEAFQTACQSEWINQGHWEFDTNFNVS